MYAIPGLPDVSQLLTSVLPNGVPIQLRAVPGTHTPLMLDDPPGKVAPQQHSEILTSNGPSLRLSDFLRNHGLELVEVDTTIPQIPVPPITPLIAPPIAHPIATPTAYPITPPTGPLIAPSTTPSVATPIAPPTAPSSDESDRQCKEETSPKVRHRSPIIHFTTFGFRTWYGKNKAEAFCRIK